MKTALKILIQAPKLYLQSCAYKRRLRSLNVDGSKLVIISTFPHSGAELMQNLIANSLYFKECLANGELYSDLALDQIRQILPNDLHRSYFKSGKYPFIQSCDLNFIQPSKAVVSNGFSDIITSEAFYQKNLFHDNFIIFLRRNPLDFFASQYLNSCQKMEANLETIKNPFDAYLRYREYFISMCKSTTMLRLCMVKEFDPTVLKSLWSQHTLFYLRCC